MSQNPEQMLPKPGDVLAGRYVLQQALGRGGSAVVFGAVDQNTGAAVAIKVLQWALSHEERYAVRFRREVQLVCRLRHHNTIRVSDFGQTPNGCLFLVMERLAGRPLDQVLEQSGPLPVARVARILQQVLLSLVEAHRQGIIHRDLKPANLFLAEDAPTADYVKVLDFGIAKALDDETSLTNTGELPCTPAYVAPELVHGGPSSAASDIYSLAILTIELLEGAPPYAGTSALEVCMRHGTMEAPVPISATVARSALGPVLARAAAKRVADRYTDAAEMLADLEQAMEHRGGSASMNTAHVGLGQQTAPQLMLGDTRIAPPPSSSHPEALSPPAEPAGDASLNVAVVPPNRWNAALPWIGAAVALALFGGLGLAHFLGTPADEDPETEVSRGISTPTGPAPTPAAPQPAAQPTALGHPLPLTTAPSQGERSVALETGSGETSEGASEPPSAAPSVSPRPTRRGPARENAAVAPPYEAPPVVDPPAASPAAVAQPAEVAPAPPTGLLNRVPSLRPE